MTDRGTSEIIGRIQDLLAAQGQVEVGVLRELAQGYADACDRVNKKAYACRELLNRGQRGEAFVHAKESPDIRDEFRQVSVLAGTSWLEVCEKLDLPLPPFLDNEAISGIIEEVYSAPPDHDRRWAVYRRMCIGQAPVADRLRTLRRICREENQPDFWKEDIGLLEKARLAELAQEGTTAIERDDLAAVDSVIAELRSREWMVENPAVMAQRAEKMAEPLRKKDTEATYARLMEAIRQANARLGEEECRQVVAQLREKMARTGIELAEEQATELSHVEAWLTELQSRREQEQAFQRACETLEAALDDKKDLPEIEKLAAEVLRFENGMPELLAARYASRVQELRRAGKRKFVAIMAGVVGVVLLIAAGVAAAIILTAEKRALARWQDELSRALERKDLEGARKLLERVKGESPRIYEAPEIQRLEATYRQEENLEQARKAELEEVAKALESAPVNDLALEALGPLDASASRGLELARTYEERARIYTQKERLQNRRAAVAAEQRKGWESQVSALESKLDLAIGAQKAGSPRAGELAEECLAATSQPASTPGMPADLLAKISLVQRDARRIIQDAQWNVQKQAAVRELCDKLRSALPSVDALATEMKGFADKFPEHPLSADFRKALAEAPRWKAEVSYGAMVSRWGDARVTDANTAEARWKEVNDFLAANLDCPRRKSLQDYSAYLAVAATACREKRGPLGLAELQTMLDADMMTRLYCLQTTDGRRYYVRERDLAAVDTATRYDQQQKFVRQITFDYAINGKMETKKARKDLEDIVDSKTIFAVEKPKIPLAPHVGMAKNLQTTIADFEKDKRKGWETVFVRLARQAYEDKDTDATLRAYFTMTCLKRAAMACPVAVDSIGEAVAKLEKIDLEVPWMDPDSVEATRSREKANQALQAIAAPKAMLEAVEMAVAEHTKLPLFKPVGVVLDVPGSGRIQLWISVDGAELYWMATSGPGGGEAFKKVGEVKQDKLSLDEKALADVPQGSLVFAKRN